MTKTTLKAPDRKNFDAPEDNTSIIAQNHLDAGGECPQKREKGQDLTKKVRQKILPLTPPPIPTAAPAKKSCHAEFRKPTNQMNQAEIVGRPSTSHLTSRNWLSFLNRKEEDCGRKVGAISHSSATKRKREEEKGTNLGALAPKLMTFSSQRIGLSEFAESPKKMITGLVNRTHCLPSKGENLYQAQEHRIQETDQDSE